MRTNKAILDEAARSVRRTFIGSVAGTAGMLAVVGAAGAYGMPEKLTTQALSLAMAKFSRTFPRDPVAPQPQQKAVVMTVAQNMPAAEVSDAAPLAMPKPAAAKPSGGITEIVRIAPPASEPAPVASAPAVAAPAPVAAVAASVVAPVVATSAPVVAAPKPVAAAKVEPAPAPSAKLGEAASAFALALPPSADPTVVELSTVVPAIEPRREPEPVQTASIGPTPIPAPEAPPSTTQQISAPMVFEAPKPSDAQTLSALPKTEVVVASATPEPVQAQKPQLQFPMSVNVALPLPKPPLSPAQRLELQGKDYDKAEKCLAQAVYFEARNEPARGQQAVAQVVLNRVFSPYYPKDVCSVVYQNAQRHLSCQFTFACDGKPETIRERGAWARANRIAKQTLEAKVWLPEVAKATHYHAAYVHPRWVRDMRVMVRYGLHTFYRPRNWGDGSNEPSWGTAANSAKTAPVKAVSVKHPVPAPRAYRRIALRRASA